MLEPQDKHRLRLLIRTEYSVLGYLFSLAFPLFPYFVLLLNAVFSYEIPTDFIQFEAHRIAVYTLSDSWALLGGICCACAGLLLLLFGNKNAEFNFLNRTLRVTRFPLAVFPRVLSFDELSAIQVVRTRHSGVMLASRRDYTEPKDTFGYRLVLKGKHVSELIHPPTSNHMEVKGYAKFLSQTIGIPIKFKGTRSDFEEMPRTVKAEDRRPIGGAIGRIIFWVCVGATGLTLSHFLFSVIRVYGLR